MPKRLRKVHRSWLNEWKPLFIYQRAMYLSATHPFVSEYIYIYSDKQLNMTLS